MAIIMSTTSSSSSEDDRERRQMMQILSSVPSSPRSVLAETMSSNPLPTSKRNHHKSCSSSSTRRRVSFAQDDENQVHYIQPLNVDESIKTDVWYSVQELMDMQYRINEMISRLQHSNPTFVEIMFGDTLRGLERIIAKYGGNGCQHEEDRRTRQDERRKARLNTVIASVLWSNCGYQKPEEIGTSWSPLSLWNFGGDSHQRTIVYEYRQTSRKAANDAVDLALEDATFVHDCVFPTTTPNTLAVGEVDDALRNVHTKLLFQNHHHSQGQTSAALETLPLQTQAVAAALAMTTSSC